MNAGFLSQKRMNQILIRALILFSLFILYTIASSQAANTKAGQFVGITHITNPAMPGKLSVLVGDGWDEEKPDVRMIRLINESAGMPSSARELIFSDAQSIPIRVVRHEPQVLTCDFPEDDFSVYAVSIKGEKGWSKPVIVNAAETQWVSKEKSFAGDTVRVFGRNLVDLDIYPKTVSFEQNPGYGSYVSYSKTKIYAESAKGEIIPCTVTKTSAYDVHFVLPESLSVGACKIYAHNGLGGEYGWSEPLDLMVEKHPQWSSKVFDVTDFGAIGRANQGPYGFNDDTQAIQEALDAAGANGGGIVYLPAGSYYVTKTLVIPERVVMKGESRERAWIFFPDAIDHGVRWDYEAAQSVEIGLRGTSNFELRDLSIHSVYTNMLIAAPMTTDSAKQYSELDLNQRAENIIIDNCNIVHEPYYRYHHRKNDPFLQKSSQSDESWGMKATLAFHGDNITVKNSRVRGGGMGIALLSCKNTTISHNELIIGRAANAVCTREFGYPAVQPQKLILEDNKIWPATPVSHSGFWGHATSRDYYIARNSLQLTWGCDSEGILWHGWGPEQGYEVASAKNNTLSVKADSLQKGIGWECIVVKGKGLGQRRIVKEIKGNVLVLDEPWQINPAEGSRVALMYYHVHDGHIIIQNKLSDTGAGIFCWGESWDWIVDGNTMTRGGGVMFDVCSFSKDRAWSGNYFNQVLHNRVDQGRYNNHIVNGVWTIGYTGTGYYRMFNEGGVIGNLGHIYRGNLCTNDAAISFWDREFGPNLKEVGDNGANRIRYDSEKRNYDKEPSDVGMVVESNWFKDCNLGISVGQGVLGVERNNHFLNVDIPIRRSKGTDMMDDTKQ